MPKLSRLFVLFAVLICHAHFAFAQTDTVTMVVDVDKKLGAFTPLWGYFGYDEANYTTMKDGRKLLAELGALGNGPKYVRVHNLLTSGDGKAGLKWSSTNAYTEDAQGKPVYNWSGVDAIFDEFIKNGMKPIAEIGFMPEALSVKPKPYQHHWKPGISYDSIFTGWAYPPADYTKWRALVFNWVKHCVAKYGVSEVASWYWEVWNEPNIGYWKGTQDEYFMLYDYAADAVKAACPQAKVGGPTTTGPRWNKAADFLKAFLQHCTVGKNYATGKTGAPLDYITFHAKGDPKVVGGHVQMNMAVQLQDVAKGFEVMNAVPEVRNLPVIIGEFDPEGCAACSVQFNPQNAYRNGTMYSSYTAASFARLYALAAKYNINLLGAVSWSFEFEDQPWFAGFRDLATNGVDKPVLNIFRMFAKMQGQMLEVYNPGLLPLQHIVDSSVRGSRPDVNAMATAGEHDMYVMAWNYHDHENAAADARITLQVNHIPAKNAHVEEYMVDEANSNAYTVWQAMGSPQQVSPSQVQALEQAGQLKRVAKSNIAVANGQMHHPLLLKPRAVALVKISW
jgi:xylan 1,4-beta-xylosidase